VKVSSIYCVSPKQSSNFNDLSTKNNLNKLFYSQTFDTVNFQGRAAKVSELLESVVKLTKKEASAKGYIPVSNAKSLHEALSKAQEKKYIPDFLAEEHLKVLNEPRVKIILMSDIKLDKTLENNWTPIETFGGEFNGNGYEIAGLRINLPSENNVCMFRSVKNAQIENLILTDVEVKGGKNTGALIGVNNYNFNNVSETRQNLPIQNCLVEGSVTGTENVGGIVGDINNAIVKSCVSKIDVTGDLNVGGIIGANNYSKTFDCVSKAKIIGNYRVGGLVGFNVVSRVENCSSEVDISGNRFIGGIVGYDYWSNIKNCKSKGTLAGKEFIGGIVGSKTDISEITDCASNCNLHIKP